MSVPVPAPESENANPSPVPVDPRIEAAAKAMWGNDATWGSADATQKSFRLSLAFAAVEAIDALAAADAVLTPPRAPHNAYADPAGGGWHGYQAACHDCDWRSENVYDHPPGGGAKEAAQTEAREHEATMARAAVVSPPASELAIERISAAVKLCYPDDMTPAAKRMFDSILQELRAVVSPPDVYEHVGWRHVTLHNSFLPLSTFPEGHLDDVADPSWEPVYRKVER